MKSWKEVFRWLGDNFGEREAAVDYPKGERITFKELNRGLNAMSAFYREEAGMEKGDRMITLCRPSVAHQVSAYASQKFGGISSNLSHLEGVEGLKWMANVLKPKVMVYDEDLVEKVEGMKEMGLPSVEAFVSIGGSGDSPEEFTYNEIMEKYSGAEEPDIEVNADDDCNIIFTSGTTGRPKPITFTNQGRLFLISNSPGLESYWERFLYPYATNFMAWWAWVGSTMYTAATMVYLREFTISDVLSALGEEKITTFFAVPSLWPWIIGELEENPEKYDLDSLERVHIGGEKISESELRRIREKVCPKIFHTYYMTETAGTHTYPFLDRNVQKSVESVGLPFPETEIKIRDPESGEPKERGEEGEIYIHNPMTETSRVWKDTPVDTEEVYPNGWCKTGDTGYIDEEGYLYLTGRMDFMFKSGGVKIHAEDVSDKLSNHPDVIDSVVVPISHEKWGKVPKAYIRNSKKLKAEDLDKWWAEQEFASYLRPKSYEFLGEEDFPRTTTGKVDREKLKKNE